MAEPDFVFKVFVALMAEKDSDHVARITAFALGRKCWPNDVEKSERRALDALNILSSPDTKRIEPQPYDGRRIQKVEDGWLILNGEKYRKQVSDEMRKSRLRRAQDTYRKKHGKSFPIAGEVIAVKAHGDGDDETFERLAAGEVFGGMARVAHGTNGNGLTDAAG